MVQSNHITYMRDERKKEKTLDHEVMFFYPQEKYEFLRLEEVLYRKVQGLKTDAG